MEHKKNTEGITQEVVLGLIKLTGSSIVKAEEFVKTLAVIYNKGIRFKPDCNVWFRVKPEAFEAIEKRDYSEAEKTDAKSYLIPHIGAPCLFVGEDPKRNVTLVTGLGNMGFYALTNDLLYKIKSEVYIKKLKKVLFASDKWEEVVKPLVYLVRFSGFDKCKSFPDIDVNSSEDEKD